MKKTMKSIEEIEELINGIKEEVSILERARDIINGYSCKHLAPSNKEEPDTKSIDAKINEKEAQIALLHQTYDLVY